MRASAPTRLVLQEPVTLRSPAGSHVIDPIAISLSQTGTYYIADRSERIVWAYGEDGAFQDRIPRAADSSTSLRSVQGTALVADMLGIYDLHGAAISFFDAQGDSGRSLTIAHQETPKLRTITGLGDSLILATLYPAGRSRAPLVEVMDDHGRVRARLFARKDYFQRHPPFFAALSIPIAHGAADWILAGMRGNDSLFAYDYSGRGLARGRIELPGLPVVSHERLLVDWNAPRTPSELPGIARRIQQIGGVMLERIVVVDASTAIVQLNPPHPEAQHRRFYGDSAVLLPIRLDRDAAALVVGEPLRTRGTLLGTNRTGGALLLRGGRARGTTEVVTVQVQ